MSRNEAEIFQKVAAQEMTVAEALSLLEGGGSNGDGRKSSPKDVSTFPLSEGQKGLWVIYQMAPQNYAYNVPSAYWIPQGIDLNLLQEALRMVIGHHPAFRVTIHTGAEEPYQTVHPEQEFAIVEKQAAVESLPEILQMIDAEAKQPFQFDTGPLARFTLFSFPGKKPGKAGGVYILLMNFHHIVIDGVSLAIFLRELQQYYGALKNGQICRLTPAAASYQQFVEWQQRMLRGEEGQVHRNYWLGLLGGDIAPLDLQLDQPRPIVPAYHGATYAFTMDETLTSQLNALALQHNVTLYVVTLAAYYVLLFRYTHQEEIIVGTPMLGRPEERFADVSGYFVNMVPVKLNLTGDFSFETLLASVWETVLSNLEHSNYPFFAIARELEKAQNRSAQLFPVTFHFQNWLEELGDKESSRPESFFLEPIPEIHQEGEFDLSLEIYQAGYHCKLMLKYNPDIFDSSTITRMAGHYLRLLQDALEHPKQEIERLRILTPEEENLLLVEWNDTASQYPRDQCVHELFEEQVKRTPKSVAVRFEGQHLTYEELNEKADALALYLNRQGLKVENFVGIFMEPSLEMLIGLLGVLKAGGAYVPLDPSSPTDRMLYMMDDTKVRFIITLARLQPRIPSNPAQAIRLDEDWPQIKQEISESPKGKGWSKREKAGPQNLAYIIYTSGSTGKPKGVQVYHRGLTNVIWSMAKAPGFTAADKILGLTTICFDIAMVEMFLPIIEGGLVDILPAGLTKDGMKLRERIEKTDATVVQATPATWQMLMAAEWEIKKPFKIITAGEALSKELAGKLLARGKEVWNQYGPTENSIYTSISQVLPGEKITIGRPIHNNQVYILDCRLQPVPIGVTGELYIGGDGLAKGYLNRPELNTQSFIPNPFSKDPESRLYKTGDLVRYLANGEIDYLGRIDNQIKLRGFRIELGEIESAILKNPGVQEAIVVLREDNPGHKRLVAFLILKDPTQALTNSQRKDALKKWLPEYMIPSTFVVVETLPLTLSRKVDRKILSSKKLAEITEKYGGKDLERSEAVPEKEAALAPPPVPIPVSQDSGNCTLSIQREIAGVVAKIINVDPAEIQAETHLGEYGFDSIRFTTLSVKLSKQLQLELNPALFFEYSTVSAFADYLWTTYPSEIGLRYQHQAYPASKIQTSPGEKIPERQESLGGVQSDNSGIPSGIPVGIPAAPCGTGEPVAIIGISGVMPQSPDLEAFWANLDAARDLVTEVPMERWDWREYYGDPTREENKTNSKWGGFIAGADQFDASFFGISRREAELMDPQQRLFLETGWKAIEDAGYKPSDLAGTKTGVFVGVTSCDYVDILRENMEHLEAYTLSGLSRTIIPNRFSFLLNLQGPSVYIDTACSSSLVALHKAVTAIHNGDCQQAIAGGVNLLLSPISYIALSQTGMLSEDGRCKAFDQSANGYVRGEGVAALLLKPLRQATADRDHIYAVIKGSSENHGGRTNSLTAPNANGQAELIITAFERANIGPETVSYMETHGTGTHLGDPIEINGLKKAFTELFQRRNQPVPKKAYCGIGSVKSNIGHLEATAGIAGVLKVVLAMNRRRLPASIHIQEVNPYIELEGSPFYLVRENLEWKPLRDSAYQPLPRRAGVSSFGFGGANAHVILEEYQDQNPEAGLPASMPQIIVISAKSEERLLEYVRQISAFLAKRREEYVHHLQDVAYTMQMGREALEERLAMVVSSFEELLEILTQYGQGKTQFANLYRGNVKERAKTQLLIEGEEGQEFVERIIGSKKISKLAQLWVMGIPIDWSLLYTGRKPQRIALPTYPFKPERYWVDKPSAKQPSGGQLARLVKLRPFIDFNESTLMEQCYSLTPDLNDPYFNQYSLAKVPILSEILFLEMAFSAGELASQNQVWKMRKAVWAGPINLLETPEKIRISLYPVTNGMEYEISGGLEAKTAYFQGQFFMGSKPAGEGRVDLKNLLNQGSELIHQTEFYRRLAEQNLEYGTLYQAVQSIHANQSGLLARLSIPVAARGNLPGATGRDFVLNPALMAGVIQSTQWLAGQRFPVGALYCAAAMEEMELLNPLTEECYVQVALSPGQVPGDSGSLKFDIQGLNSDGQVLLRIRGFTLRPVQFEAIQGISTVQTSNLAPYSDFDTRAHAMQKEPEVLMSLLDRLAKGELDLEEADSLTEEMLYE